MKTNSSNLKVLILSIFPLSFHYANLHIVSISTNPTLCYLSFIFMDYVNFWDFALELYLIATHCAAYRVRKYCDAAAAFLAVRSDRKQRFIRMPAAYRAHRIQIQELNLCIKIKCHLCHFNLANTFLKWEMSQTKRWPQQITVAMTIPPGKQ